MTLLILASLTVSLILAHTLHVLDERTMARARLTKRSNHR